MILSKLFWVTGKLDRVSHHTSIVWLQRLLRHALDLIYNKHTEQQIGASLRRVSCKEVFYACYANKFDNKKVCQGNVIWPLLGVHMQSPGKVISASPKEHIYLNVYHKPTSANQMAKSKQEISE